LPDPAEDSNAGLEVTLRNILDQFRPQVVGGIENLFQDRFGTPLEMNGFAAAIIRRFAALDPAVVLEAVEQARQSRFLDSHPLSDFFLGKFVSALGKMDQRPPFPLA